MRNFTTYCNFPHYCRECEILFEANLFEKGERLCPECGKNKVIPYDDKRAFKSEGKEVFSWNVKDEIGRELKLTDGKYICPNCRKFSLMFSDIGSWD